MVNTLGGWVHPLAGDPRHAWARGAALIVLMAVVALLAWRAVMVVKSFQRRRTVELVQADVGVGASISIAMGIFSICYLPAVVLAIMFVDASTPLDRRILMPLYLPLLIVIFSAIRAESGRLGRGLRIAGVAAAGLVLFWNVPYTRAWMKNVCANGQGVNSVAWQKSKLMQRVRTMPSDRMIYSNGYDMIGLHAHRTSLSLPVRVHLATGKLDGEYDARMAEMIRRVREEGAVVVYFTGVRRAFLPTAAEVEKALEVPAIYSTTMPVSVGGAEGVVFGVDRRDR